MRKASAPAITGGCLQAGLSHWPQLPPGQAWTEAPSGQAGPLLTAPAASPGITLLLRCSMPAQEARGNPASPVESPGSSHTPPL